MAAARRSEQQWRDLIEHCEQSGESAKRFCEAHAISLNWFYKKRRKLKEGQGESRFVPVRVRGDAVVIQMGDLSLRCSPNTPVTWIADLARALR